MWYVANNLTLYSVELFASIVLNGWSAVVFICSIWFFGHSNCFKSYGHFQLLLVEKDIHTRIHKHRARVEPGTQRKSARSRFFLVVSLVLRAIVATKHSWFSISDFRSPLRDSNPDRQIDKPILKDWSLGKSLLPITVVRYWLYRLELCRRRRADT